MSDQQTKSDEQELIPTEGLESALKVAPGEMCASNCVCCLDESCGRSHQLLIPEDGTPAATFPP